MAAPLSCYGRFYKQCEQSQQVLQQLLYYNVISVGFLLISLKFLIMPPGEDIGHIFWAQAINKETMCWWEWNNEK